MPVIEFATAVSLGTGVVDAVVVGLTVDVELTIETGVFVCVMDGTNVGDLDGIRVAEDGIFDFWVALGLLSGIDLQACAKVHSKKMRNSILFFI